LLVACEALLRAFLLVSQLEIEKKSQTGKSLADRFSKEYSRAQLLLTADTLFTWPLELVAAEKVSGLGPHSVALAQAFGINGCLAALDSAKAGISGLVKLNPFLELLRTLGISDTGSDREITPAAQWLYYNELKHWFGQDEIIGRQLKELEVRTSGLLSSDEPQVRNLAELVSFLKD
jgi:hypothetical protein